MTVLCGDSERHHRGEHVSVRGREEGSGGGVVPDGPGQVSLHRSAESLEGLRRADLLRVHRMDQVIVHVGAMSLSDSQDLVSRCSAGGERIKVLREKPGSSDRRF